MTLSYRIKLVVLYQLLTVNRLFQKIKPPKSLVTLRRLLSVFTYNMYLMMPSVMYLGMNRFLTWGLFLSFLRLNSFFSLMIILLGMKPSSLSDSISWSWLYLYIMHLGRLIIIYSIKAARLIKLKIFISLIIYHIEHFNLTRF